MLDQKQASRLIGIEVAPFSVQWHDDQILGFVSLNKVEPKQAETIARAAATKTEGLGAIVIAGLIDAIGSPSEEPRGSKRKGFFDCGGIDWRRNERSQNLQGVADRRFLLGGLWGARRWPA
jgi:hypothetical protein